MRKMHRKHILQDILRDNSLECCCSFSEFEFHIIIYQTNFNDRKHKKLMWRSKINRWPIAKRSLSQWRQEKEYLIKIPKSNYRIVKVFITTETKRTQMGMILEPQKQCSRPSTSSLGLSGSTWFDYYRLIGGSLNLLRFVSQPLTEPVLGATSAARIPIGWRLSKQ